MTSEIVIAILTLLVLLFDNFLQHLHPGSKSSILLCSYNNNCNPNNSPKFGAKLAHVSLCMAIIWAETVYPVCGDVIAVLDENRNW